VQSAFPEHGIGPVVLPELLSDPESLPLVLGSPVIVVSSPLVDDAPTKHAASSSILMPSPHGL